MGDRWTADFHRVCLVRPIQPPPILCLHLVRSEYTQYGQIVKKTSQIHFPLILDITTFTTSGSLHMDSNGPISRHNSPLSSPATEGWTVANGRAPPPSDTDSANPLLVLYRLEALICHYGYTHSFGHFVAYRRKPGSAGAVPPRKSCPDYCTCPDCLHRGQVRTEGTGPMGRGWLRISDADVEEVGEREVLNEMGSVVLLFYERVEEYVFPSVGGEQARQGRAHGGAVDALIAEGLNGVWKRPTTEDEEPKVNL